ncbi:MAG TPA: ribosomal protein S18-alanine N-acetyltransferase [Clostridia bacterium]|nr:ribosomal protein S18-alanine N-acetyltransferase [Clostridia bacterium]
MDQIFFRPMQKADLNRVAELEKICFRSPWSYNALAGELKNDVAHYRVAEKSGVVIGYAGMWLICNEAHITNVAIAPVERGKGFGRALMLTMMRLAVSLGADDMTLEVRESNLPAQSLYYKLGFEKAGVRKKYYSDTGESAYILWLKNIKSHLPSERSISMKQTIISNNAPAAIGPYSHAVISGSFVFTCGLLGVDPATGKLKEGVEAQAEQALVNLNAVLNAAGASLSDVVKTTVFLHDMKDFPLVNKIYGAHFEGGFPARSCVQVAALPAGGLVEIEAVAALSK